MNISYEIPEKPKMNVVFIHGTWGRGFFATGKPVPDDDVKGFWFSKGSPFRIELAKTMEGTQFECVYHSRLWGGLNSFESRHSGSEDLERYLSALPGEKLIICHSHGGNLGAIALSKMKESCRLVSLATPFVEIVDAKTDSYNEFINLCAWCFISCPVIISTFFMLATNFQNSWVWATAISLLLVVIWNTKIGNNIQAAINRNGRLYDAARHIEAKTKYNIPSNHKLLVIRGVNDEALVPLTAGLFANGISFYVLKYATSLMNYLIISVIIGAVILLSENKDSALTIIKTIKYIVYACALYPFLLIFVLIISSGCKALFGKDIFLNSLWCDLKINSSPDFDGALKAVTLFTNFQDIESKVRSENKYSGLRHGIYNHPDVPKIIADWVNSD